MKNKTFREAYDALSLERKATIASEITLRCNISHWTFLAWLTGSRTPKESSQEIIAEVLGAPASQLFPVL